MYDDVYDAMVEAGVAKKLDEPIWVNNEGIETDEKDAFGRKATHALCHPDYVVFVDEVGCNTSQEGDGAHGGKKRLLEEAQFRKRVRPQMTTTSHCWNSCLLLESLLCAELLLKAANYGLKLLQVWIFLHK
jgi:hypothetical protein